VVLANQARRGAEDIIHRCKSAIEETDKYTKNGQREVNTRLSQRSKLCEHWSTEIDVKLEQLGQEIDLMLEYKTRVEKALHATQEPLMINQRCQQLREERVKTDMVHDKVEKDLAKEIETIQACQELLAITRDKIIEQIRKDRSGRYYLEKDRKDKTMATELDIAAMALNNNTTTLTHRPLSVRTIRGSHPDHWQNFTEVNIAKGEKERTNSKNLRSATDGILRQTSEDLISANNLTTHQFKERIADTKRAKKEFEDNLDKVLGEISNLEKQMRELEIAIEEKDAPLMVAESRMDIRQHRPKIELCRDPAVYRLHNEVVDIETNIARLRGLHYESSQQLKDLLRQQLTLQEDIKVKENTIYIDEACCLVERESIKFQFF